MLNLLFMHTYKKNCIEYRILRLHPEYFKMVIEFEQFGIM